MMQKMSIAILGNNFVQNGNLAVFLFCVLKKGPHLSFASCNKRQKQRGNKWQDFVFRKDPYLSFASLISTRSSSSLAFRFCMLAMSWIGRLRFHFSEATFSMTVIMMAVISFVVNILLCRKENATK